MMSKYLIPIPAAGGRYPVTVGMVRPVLNRIKSLDPDSEIHYSGVSSGSACALMFLCASIANLDIEVLHDEFIELIKTRVSSDPANAGYYQKNDKFFEAMEALAKKYITDINQINGKLHIGYCKLSRANGLEFAVVSEYKDIYDLTNAIRASCHYSLVLRNSMYFEYRGDMCVDGIFMYDQFLVPGYKNVVLNCNVLNKVNMNEILLNPCKEKYQRLYKIGDEHQKDKEVEFIEPSEHPAVTSEKIISMWNWASKLAYAWSAIATGYTALLVMLKCTGSV
ncbi:Acyl transferase/acyl hydrolase/lysophospholipase [Yasminevirus sp. GU-2018]|uniref:Acyl transferase/acyl hydrolase/lysophospholipase n=1 Tax=Yasminevirus sp. GU-2018 TaxID=2420051 RepID=A0A5K0U788_9VIRU|nr:Acyl transferase/acyl hydrolase/lysophospholipase [Yasminevirus sp. GU-2018]